MKERNGNLSIVHAVAVLGGSSFVTIFISLVSTKLLATLLEPHGYGYMGLLQSMVSIAGLIAGWGVAAGVVRFGAGKVAQNDLAGIAALLRAAWFIIGVMSGISIIVLVTFRTPLSQLVLGTTDHSLEVALMGIVLMLGLSTNLQGGILNAYRRVKALAKISVIGTLLGSLTSVAFVVIWREQGIVPSMISGALVAWLVSWRMLRKEVEPVHVCPQFRETVQATRSLLSFGGSYASSMVFGVGVQMALPILVLETLGMESVGYYRAATGISVTYLGFLINAMAQDYYPRISAVSEHPHKLIELANNQQRLILLIAVPVILATLALAPYIVPLIYSSKFLPTIEVLEWQLIGDLFKFSSWTMSFIILARCSGRTYFFTELTAGVAAAGTSWLGIQWFGLAGLGISFVSTYMIYYLVVWAVVRREINFVWSRPNRCLLVVAVTAMLIVRLMPSLGLIHWRTPVAFAFSFIAAIGSLYLIWQEPRGGDFALTRRLPPNIIDWLHVRLFSKKL
jgi:PST family polysaccharide transporter